MANTAKRQDRHIATSELYGHTLNDNLSVSASHGDILEFSGKAIKEFTLEQLQPFVDKKVSTDAIDACASFLSAPGTLKVPSLIVRCRIKASDFAINVIVDKAMSRSRLSEHFMPFLSRVLPQFRGQAEFLILLSDNLYPTPEALPQLAEHFANVPFLRCDRNDNNPASCSAILIPDFYIQQPSYSEIFERILSLQVQYPFTRRENKVMWRGSLSGPTYVTRQNVKAFPRYKLLNHSRDAPDIIDARLTNYDDDELGRYLLKRFGPSAPYISEPAFVAYKYLISIDGAAAAWRRVPTILISGSVLLLQHEWKQFFYPGLLPWIHYVPLRKDLGDLREKYEWLEAHPVEAQAIASSGQAFAMRYLTPQAIERHFLDVLLSLSGEYAG